MAKLPKVKSRMDDAEETTSADIEVAGTEEAVDSESPNVEQGDAVAGILDHVAGATAGSTDSEEDTDVGDESEEHPEKDADSTTDEEVVEGTDDNFGVTITAPETKVSTKATTVKVATVCDHSCHIGGIPYHFVKGVPTSVPEPVKQILKNAGLLAAL